MTRHAPLLLLALAAGLLAPACGRKTPVRPPELAAPERIDNLTAANAADGIALSWKRPRQYADGTSMLDLGGFRIERRRDGAPFAYLATIAVTDRERLRQTRRFRYLDRAVNAGDTYRYRVVAFTVDEYASEPSNVADIVRAVPTPGPTPSPTP